MQTVPPKLVIVGIDRSPTPTTPNLDPANIEGLDRCIRPIDEALGCIYQILCLVSGKCYIGQAKLIKYKDGKAYYYGPKGRWSDHRSDAKGGSPKLIHQAIRQYGPENFRINVLKVDIITVLDQLESNYIASFNTMIPNGYNVQRESDNRYTSSRIQQIQEKYGNIIQPQDPALMDELRRSIQAELDDVHHEKWRIIKDKRVTRIRIKDTVMTSASRQNGRKYTYDIVVVYVYTIDIRYAKDAKQLKFGGIHIPLHEAYRDALQFARRIPLEPGGQFDDQVRLSQ